MNQWPDPNSQGQQPFQYQDPGQQSAWPGTYQQPGQVEPTQAFQPMPSAPDPMIGGEPVLVTIGDISVTATTVHTPSGSRPLSEVQWTFTDMSMNSAAIPTWAIICAVVFFVFCFLGLLFLLAKENKTTGSVQVTVSGPGFVHTTMIPVSSPEQVADYNARVNYARTLTASAYPAVGGQASTSGQASPAGQTFPAGQAFPGGPGQTQQASDPGQTQPAWPQAPGNEPGAQDQQPGQGW